MTDVENAITFDHMGDGDDSPDFTLADDVDSIWLTIETLSLWIRKYEKPEGGKRLVVEVYPRYLEAAKDPIDALSADFN